jgi:hypothetical protein
MAKKNLTVQEAAALCPNGTKIVTDVPDAWLKTIPDSTSVWNSLYRWLGEKHGVSEGDRSDLHNRTFVGKELAKRLDTAETKRIKGRHKLTGEKLKKAFAWSTGDTGPHERFRGHRLNGNALFVVFNSDDAWA